MKYKVTSRVGNRVNSRTIDVTSMAELTRSGLSSCHQNHSTISHKNSQEVPRVRSSHRTRKAAKLFPAAAECQLCTHTGVQHLIHSRHRQNPIRTLQTNRN